MEIKCIYMAELYVVDGCIGVQWMLCIDDAWWVDYRCR